MRRALLSLAMATALGAPLAVRAQSLPDEVRSAGITVGQWQSVQLSVRRAATQKHVSETALAGVCAKMGVALSKGRHLDLTQLIQLMDEKADEIAALYQRLALLEQQNDAGTATSLRQARTAIDAGDLDHADQLLEQARTAASAARVGAQEREGEVIAAEADVRTLRADYLGAAAIYAEAVDALPATDVHDRWRFTRQRAQVLDRRGELFAEPAQIQQAVDVLQDCLRLAPRATSPADWADTENDLGNVLRAPWLLGEATARSFTMPVTAFQQALQVRTRERDASAWGVSENDLGVALKKIGDRGDDQALRDAAVAFRAALEVRTRDRSPADWAKTQTNLGSTLFPSSADVATTRTLERRGRRVTDPRLRSIRATRSEQDVG